MLEKYAELIVKQGVNVQPGQDVVITSDVCNAGLVGCFIVGAEQNSNSALFFMTFLSNFVYFSIVIFRNV